MRILTNKYDVPLFSRCIPQVTACFIPHLMVHVKIQ